MLNKLKVSTQTEINLLIDRIEGETRAHKDLINCGHFLFDFPISTGEVKDNPFLVMGINPGLSKKKEAYIGALREDIRQETSRANTFESFSKGDQSARRWHLRCKTVLGTDNIFLGELFFWSTKDLLELEQRFGKLINNKHLDFCRQINQRMIELRKPRAIIFPGISKASLVSDLYGLKKCDRHDLMGDKNHRLLSFYMYGQNIPWIFTKHFSARGISNEEIQAIRMGINEFI